MKVRCITSLLAAMAGAQMAFAQSPFIRSDEIEVKRIGAMATVQRLARPARSGFDPHVALSSSGTDPKRTPAASGGDGCTFNIGDIASAQQADGQGQPVARKGLQRIEYITLVEGTQICVER